ncbi:DinB family protein [Jeotgalibacillus sp. ET6]|uniref:DinB family protein n=1 Tax=Jeotgalibacillus sp. ET6 TaxID=3037260 RepID=UPI0024189B58|nr:DinB family protein [Jeotgalibacillus sp. ET6]MDG5472300.1 DinB family protein [Jeotgalibacillus sp. ET6]
MNKTIKQFEKAISFIEPLKKYPEAFLTEPIQDGKWSIREIAGHLYYWDKYNFEKMVPEMEDGVRLPEFPDHDWYNAEGLRFLEGISAKAVIDLFIRMRNALVEKISAVDEDLSFTIGSGKRTFSPESFIRMFVEHDRHHLKQIEGKVDLL